MLICRLVHLDSLDHRAILLVKSQVALCIITIVLDTLLHIVEAVFAILFHVVERVL